jgi:hypothetical protein
MGDTKTMRTEFNYPKHLFSRSEVERQMHMFQFPLAWDLRVEAHNYKLILNQRKLDKFYSNKGF